MNLEKNIIEIVKRENKNLDKSFKDLDKTFQANIKLNCPTIYTKILFL